MLGHRPKGTIRWSRMQNAVVVVPVIVALALTVGFGCSENGEPVEPVMPAEPTEVLDLVEGFPLAASTLALLPSGGDGGRRSKSHVNPDRRVLFVPYGENVEFDVDLPPGGVLLFQNTKVLGTAVGSLEVAWTPVDGAERILTRDLTAAPDRSACFGNTVRETGRLALRARAGEKVDHPQPGIRIVQPRVVAGLPCEYLKTDDLSRGGDQRLNIIVYLIDALRADRLGCYGYGRGTTPNIDEFASSALLFTGAQAQTSWTRPAVASIVTGLLPQQHGAIGKKDVLPASATTIAELLTGIGYESAAVVANGNVSQAYGFSQGFSYYKYMEGITTGQPVVRSDDVNNAVFAWLDEFRGSQPFFLYVHTVDPHAPYAPPDSLRAAFAPEVEDPSIGSVDAVYELAKHSDRVTPELIEQLSDLYDGEVAANDASFGELVAGLVERGLVENTVIVVLSDHGEEFFDHQGWTHGNTLYAEMLDVPLIIRIPGVAPKSITEIVQHVDVFSTLLDLAGLESPSGVFGKSARPLWTGDPEAEWTDRGLSHLKIKERFGEAWVDPRWKMLTRRLGNGEIRTSLFDRVEDPSEQIDLAEQRPDLVEALRALYREDVAAAGESLVGVEVDADREAEVEAQLRALGYL